MNFLKNIKLSILEYLKYETIYLEFAPLIFIKK